MKERGPGELQRQVNREKLNCNINVQDTELATVVNNYELVVSCHLFSYSLTKTCLLVTL